MDIPDTQLKIWLSNYHKFIWVRPNLGNTINLLDGSQHCCGANKVVIVVEECVDCWIAINVVCSSNVFCARAGKQSVFNSLYPTSTWTQTLRTISFILPESPWLNFQPVIPRSKPGNDGSAVFKAAYSCIQFWCCESWVYAMVSPQNTVLICVAVLFLNFFCILSYCKQSIWSKYL